MACEAGAPVTPLRDQEAATPNGELLARSHDVLTPIAALTNGYTRSGLKQLGPNTLQFQGLLWWSSG